MVVAVLCFEILQGHEDASSDNEKNCYNDDHDQEGVRLGFGGLFRDIAHLVLLGFLLNFLEAVLALFAADKVFAVLAVIVAFGADVGGRFLDGVGSQSEELGCVFALRASVQVFRGLTFRVSLFAAAEGLVRLFVERKGVGEPALIAFLTALGVDALVFLAAFWAVLAFQAAFNRLLRLDGEIVGLALATADIVSAGFTVGVAGQAGGHADAGDLEEVVLGLGFAFCADGLVFFGLAADRAAGRALDAGFLFVEEVDAVAGLALGALLGVGWVDGLAVLDLRLGEGYVSQADDQD